MRDITDLHTHTIASEHAYSTIREMIQAAARTGLEVLGFTEHAESCSHFYFTNMRIIPREQMGITILRGVEANIIDHGGHVDLPDSILSQLDVVIASMHMSQIKPGSPEENTRAYLSAMKNPYVHVIGHPDDSRFPVDYKELAYGAKQYGTLLEINNHSLSPTGTRDTERAKENYQIMLEHCKAYETPVIMGSDAHIDVEVGEHGEATKILEASNFPAELVVNSNKKLLKKFIPNCP